ncbi:TPA: branched-chain amino acid ABC transporter permease LivH, partial [Serratia marcescens]
MRWRPYQARLLIMDVFFLQQLINGLTLGAVYGLIAIGYTM